MHWHKRILFGGVLLIIIAALLNRGGGPLMSHLILTVITFLIAASAYFFRKHFESKSLNIPEIFLIGFLVFFIVSFFFSRTPNYGINELLLFSNATILILLIRRSGISEKDVEYFKTGLIFIALAEALVGIFIYTKFAYPRFGGTFIDLGAPYTSFANDFANFSLLLLPLCFEKFFRVTRVGEKVMYGLIAGIVSAAFLLSFSRGGWIAFAVAMLVWGIWLLIIHRKNIRTYIKGFILKTVILVVITVGIVTSIQLMRGLVFPVNTFLGKATLSADEGGASIKERLDFWKGATHLIAERPIFGHGILSFRFLYPKYQPDFGANWDHPHNMMLKIGVENGLPTAILFLGFLMTFAWKFMKESKRLIFILPLMIGALASFGHNLVDYNYIVANFILFAVFLGIGLSLLPPETRTFRFSVFFSTFFINLLFEGGPEQYAGEVPKGKHIFRTPRKFPIVFLCLIGSLLLVLLAIHEGYYSYVFKKGRIALANNDFKAAEQYLEKSQGLYFERDLFISLASLYQEQKNPRKEAELLRGQSEGIRITSRWGDTVDASILNRLAELALESSPPSRGHALDYLERILFVDPLDPKNRLRYYYNYYVRLNMGHVSPKAAKEKFLPLLEEYENVLRKNSHFTIVTDNPKYAIKLYEYFEDEESKSSANRLRQIWLREIEKYVKKYGPLPEPAPL